MYSLIPTNEYTEFEDRLYQNPQTGIDENQQFIENLRSVQQQNNAQINADTRALGIDVPSNLGGLTGGEGYFTSRMQTPQTNVVTANLRAAAQAAALSQALENEQAIWKKRYNDAYRAYQKRQNDKQNTDPYANVPGDEPDTKTTTPKGTVETSVSGYPGARTVTDMAGNLHVVDTNTGDEDVITPGGTSKTRKSASQAVGGGELRTLPNGNVVLIKPGYNLTKENGKYYLANQTTGDRTEVGGY